MSKPILNSLIATLGFLLSQVFSVPAAHSFEVEKYQWWVKSKELADAQKLQEAVQYLEKEIAKRPNTDRSVEKGLLALRVANLKLGLHGYETSTLELKSAFGLYDPEVDSVLRLSYAQFVSSYRDAYSYEISSRELTHSSLKKELRQMTADELGLEVTSELSRVFASRNKFSAQSRKAWAPFIKANTFPTGLRDTLRDSVTYVFVDFLANTSFWSPTQNNEAFALDLKALLNLTAEIDLNSPEVHPIEKIAFLLQDLTRWHQSAGHKNAAAEAQIRLHQILYQSLNSTEAHDQLEQSLTALAEKSKSLESYSSIAGQMADWKMSSEPHDGILLAKKWADLGAQAHPKSLGAKKCRDLLAQISRPSLSMRSMRIDGSSRPSIEVRFKGIQKLYFRSYRIDLGVRMLEKKQNGALYSRDEVEALVQSAKPAYSWTSDLRAIQDFKPHQAHITPPTHAHGFYFVATSTDPQFSVKSLRADAVICFSDLVLRTSVKKETQTREVTVVNGMSGRGMPGVSLELYQFDYNTAPRLVQKFDSDSQGVVQFKQPSSDRGQFFVRATFKNDESFSNSFYRFYLDSTQPAATRSFVYTDRAIYRPGQSVFFKAIAYDQKNTNREFKAISGIELNLRLKDANGEVVATRALKTDSFGSVSGELSIPMGRGLGSWFLEAATAKVSHGSASIRVEEYKRPTFEVVLKEELKPLRLNQAAILMGEARYYFGMPLAEAKVRYRIYRQERRSWWCSWFWGFDESQPEQMVTAGQVLIDKDGSFKIEFKPKADASLEKSRPDLSYDYRIETQVTDEGGETQKNEKVYVVGFRTAEARVIASSKVYESGGSVDLKIQRTTLNGKLAPGKGKWSLYKIQETQHVPAPAELPNLALQEQNKNNPYIHPDDLKQNRWESQYHSEAALMSLVSSSRVSEGEVSHLNTIDQEVKLSKLEPATYRLNYRSVDVSGNISGDNSGHAFEASETFVVTDGKYLPQIPGFLWLQNPEVKVGQTLRVFAGTGDTGHESVFEASFQNKVLVHKVLKGGGWIEIPILDAYRGGIDLALYSVTDYQGVSLNQWVDVPWENKKLDLSFSRIRQKLTPGDSESWTIQIKESETKRQLQATAQVLSFMYDRSLDSFQKHSLSSILSIYPTRSYRQESTFHLGTGPSFYLSSYSERIQSEYREPAPDQIWIEQSYGIGGMGNRGDRFGTRGMRGSPDGMDGESMAMMREEPSMADSEAAPAPASPVGMPKVKKKARADEVRDTPSPLNESSKPQSGVRSNFSETAFWIPTLLTDKNGTVKIEFKVPDSLTSWNVMAMAHTSDLHSGSITQEVQTVKELMVRPYLPRFLREGDDVEVKVVIQNSGSTGLEGRVKVSFRDPDTQKDISSLFALQLSSSDGFNLKPQGSSTFSFKVKVPAKLGLVEILVEGQAGKISDGERRVLPILPSRMHLAQSKFKILKGNSKKSLIFSDLVNSQDSTLLNEKLVVTLDTQLFYSVLAAVPYLTQYPYECMEQTLNRFLSSAILSSVFKDYPAVAEMAGEFAKRKTQLEGFDQPDPNLKMTLEESPWLREAKGGSTENLLPILDPKISKKERDSALARIVKSQNSDGSFPWFPGGPPSDYITLYLLHGFAKALEFKVDVPKDTIQKAWGYLHGRYLAVYLNEMVKEDRGWELVTFMNYVLTAFVEPSGFSESQKKQMLDFSMKHWKQHTPYLKAYLALTAHRMKRAEDAKKVWASIMDSAIVSEEEGTHWQVEDRSWLWYNDTIESQAMVLRAGMELGTDSKTLDGIVLWLFLNKKLNQWKSTKATAEVVYSLTHYLKKTGAIGVPEKISVKMASKTQTFDFDPKHYTGKKNQLVVLDKDVTPAHGSIEVSKTTPGYAFASATWHYSTQKMPAASVGGFIHVDRKYFLRRSAKTAVELVPLKDGDSVQIGDEVEVQLSLRSKHALEYVHLRDPRAAGFEPAVQISKYKYDLGIFWFEEVRDSATNFFIENLPMGEYLLKYRLKATTVGSFQAGPATMQPMYAPEFNAFSAGERLTVKP